MLALANQFSKWDLNTFGDTWLGLSGLLKTSKKNGKKLRVSLSAYFFWSDPSKRSHHPPQYGQNTKKNLKKRINTSIFTNYRSLSQNNDLLFGKVRTPRAPLPPKKWKNIRKWIIWRVAQNRNVLSPLDSSVLTSLKFLVIWSSVRSTPELLFGSFWQGMSQSYSHSYFKSWNLSHQLVRFIFLKVLIPTNYGNSKK